MSLITIHQKSINKTSQNAQKMIYFFRRRDLNATRNFQRQFSGLRLGLPPAHRPRAPGAHPPDDGCHHPPLCLPVLLLQLRYLFTGKERHWRSAGLPHGGGCRCAGVCDEQAHPHQAKYLLRRRLHDPEARVRPLRREQLLAAYHRLSFSVRIPGRPAPHRDTENSGLLLPHPHRELLFPW